MLSKLHYKMNNDNWISRKSLMLRKKLCNPDLSFGDNDIFVSDLQEDPKDPPMQFTVEVKVEKCDIDNSTTNSSEQELHMHPDKILSNNEEDVFYIRKILNDTPQAMRQKNHTTVTQYTITSETIMKAIEEQSKDNTDDNDKCLDIICRNLNGQFKNITPSFYEEEVNRTMKLWADWYKLSPLLRSTPLMYKCYECCKGWWRLHPFIEHIKKHNNPNLKLILEQDEDDVNIVTPNQLGKVNDVKMDSNCWKCGREAAFHKHKNSPKKYKCLGCNKFIATCTRLKEHEGICMKNIKLLCRVYNIHISKGLTCTVCNIFCANKEVFDNHMTDCHLVRSDEPVFIDTKVCTQCNGRFILYKLHDCPVRNRPYECGVCYKSFTSLLLHQIHVDLSQNPIFKCKAPENYLEHTNNYCLMYIVCRKCDTKVLVTDKTMCLSHMNMHHKKIYLGRMLLPTKCLNSEVIKCETTFSVPDDVLDQFLVGSDYDINTIPSIKVIQTRPSATASIAAVDIDDDVIILDDDVIILDDEDIKSPIESARQPDNLVEKDFDICTMQAQLDEEIMRDLEMEATISKMFKASKSYNLFMQKESLDKKTEGTTLVNKKRDLIEKGPVWKSLDKGSTEKELTPEESIKNEPVELDENELTFVDDLIILDDSPTTATDSKNDGTPEADLEGDNKKEKSLSPENTSDSNQDSDMESLCVNEETVSSENSVEMESGASSQNIKVGSSDLTVDKQRLKTDNNDVNTESGNQLYGCKECDYRGEWSQYIVHVTTECSGSDFSCNSCVRFASLTEYLEHLPKHEHEPLVCPECHLKRSSLELLQKHVTFHILALFFEANTPKSQERTLYYCKKCGNCVMFMHFFKHWQVHLTSRCYKDEQGTPGTSKLNPDSATMSPELIQEMMGILQKKMKKKKDGWTDTCNVCFKKIPKIYELKGHMIEHLLWQVLSKAKRMGTKIVACYFCGNTFTKVDDWKYHMREHSHLPSYKCKLCPKRFSNSSNFTKHKKVHNLYSFECDLCGGKYNTKRFMIEHLKLHENSVACIICHQTFVSRSKLKKHISYKHAQKAGALCQHYCTWCPERFSTWKGKQQHMWLKHEIRNATADCDLCDKRFRTMTQLKKHKKRIIFGK